MTVDFDEVADELYGLPLEDFVARRSVYEKQARQAGDRATADRLRALAKPNQAAWLANQLARQHHAELQPLVELGASLREATRKLAGDELRQLSRQQHELVHALVQQARTLGRAQGHKVSEDTARGVEETLHAALVDEDAADLLLAGRLATPLHRTGLGDTAARASDRQRAARPPSSGPRPPDDGVTKAQRVLDVAIQSRDEAQVEAEQATQESTDAHTRVDELRSELDHASAAAADADKRRRERDGALRRAERAVAEAERRLAGASKPR